jgi:hypothetical protein
MKRFQAIAAATVLTAMASAGSASTVVNGSFEDVSGGSVLLNNGSWVVYDTLPGWTTIDGNGIEVQTNPTLGSIDAQDGNRYVELDSHPGGNSNSTMRQQISLGVGEYRLSFFYSPRTTDASTNGIFYTADGARWPGGRPEAQDGLTGPTTGPNLARLLLRHGG